MQPAILLKTQLTLNLSEEEQESTGITDSTTVVFTHGLYKVALFKFGKTFCKISLSFLFEVAGLG